MSFAPVLALILKLEGAYSNNASDSGGETIYGITRNYDKDWPGWKRFDALRRQGLVLGDIVNDKELKSDIASKYYSLWEQYKMDEVPEDLQGVIFGGIVNQGPKVITYLQEELQALHQMINIDGVMGSETITAMSKVEPAILHKAFWKRRAENYRDIANNHPQDEKFLLGWLNRLRDGA